MRRLSITRSSALSPSKSEPERGLFRHETLGNEPAGTMGNLFADLRRPQSGGACTSCSAYDACQGGCMAAKFFTGLPLDGPDPECVRGFGELALAGVAGGAGVPRPSGDHSHGGRAASGRGPVPVSIGRRPERACDSSPLAGFDAGCAG